ncbi:MAG: UDP-N-acetylmuramoyl-tripeptide--D-alanyl-D-alanine ligase [Terriglobia bacterium]
MPLRGFTVLEPRLLSVDLTTEEIAAVLGARFEGHAVPVRGYSIDSRTVEAGDLFFAIRGPRFNGHDFVRAALQKGAAGAVVEPSYQAASPGARGTLIRVPDATLALQVLGRAVRRRWGGPVIGVTGSAGKTTTKEMIAAALATQRPTLKSPGNLNNRYGVPLTLLGLRPDHKAAVIEMAMSGPGEIAMLAGLAEPQTGVVTNIEPVHLEFFASIDGIAAAKRELIENLSPPACAVLNHDDARMRRFADGFAGRVVTFGLSEGADYRAGGISIVGSDQEGVPATEFDVQGPLYNGRFRISMPGRHNVENALAAIATASLFDVSAAALRASLAGVRSPGQRAEILTLPQRITVLNDAYNSNPSALQQMIETLIAWPNAARRVVIAGEMLELGPSSPDWHRRAGREMAQAGIDWLVAVQGDARSFVEGALEAGLPGRQTRFYADAEEAGSFCGTIAEPGDVILVKGSRGVGLERSIEGLKRSLAAQK